MSDLPKNCTYHTPCKEDCAKSQAIADLAACGVDLSFALANLTPESAKKGLVSPPPRNTSIES